MIAAPRISLFFSRKIGQIQFHLEILHAWKNFRKSVNFGKKQNQPEFYSFNFMRVNEWRINNFKTLDRFQYGPKIIIF